MSRTRHAAAAVALAILFAGCNTSAGPFPSKEIKLIVQAAPGGLSDTVSRVIASRMEKQLGVPVVCENRPGAAGALAFSYVSRQPPTGYVIGHGPVELAMVRALGFADVGPDKVDLLGLVTKTQPVLAVNADSPWKTFAEFIGAARARPGYYVVGNSGTGSIWHINSLLMERLTGLELVHCPFGGSSASMTALLGKHIDTIVAGSGEVVSQVKAGQVRVLAVFDSERCPLFPDVPSVHELGYDFGVDTWSGFYAPAGLRPAVKRTLEAAIHTAFLSPEFQNVCQERGMTPAYLDAAQFRRFADRQAQFFGSTIPVLLGGKRK